jgi:hypothetical protein
MRPRVGRRLPSDEYPVVSVPQRISAGEPETPQRCSFVTAGVMVRERGVGSAGRGGGRKTPTPGGPIRPIIK